MKAPLLTDIPRTVCGPWTHEVAAERVSITSHHKKLKSESADAGDCKYLALVVKVT
jgi:hypothetical protein